MLLILGYEVNLPFTLEKIEGNLIFFFYAYAHIFCSSMSYICKNGPTLCLLLPQKRLMGTSFFIDIFCSPMSHTHTHTHADMSKYFFYK